MIKREIFKVQISVCSTEPKMALVYNKSMTSMGQFKPDKNLLELMGKEPKKFFYGKHPKSGPIEILEEAPWQDW